MSNEPEVPRSEVSDHGLTGAVRNALARSDEVDTRDILVNAANGVIQLTGAVRTLFEKRAAGRIAKSAPGASGVNNSLVVVPDRQPADDEIYQAVEQALGNYPEDQPAQVGVRLVEDGVAYLAGEAPSVLDAWQAEDIAARVPGVKSIVNEIDVAPGKPVDDVKINDLVIDALSEDPLIDPFSIEVHVEYGRVYLDGEVEDDEAIRMAGLRASGAAGVRGVINHLTARS